MPNWRLAVLWDITGLQEEVATPGAEVTDRVDAIERRLSAIGTVLETRHGVLPRPGN